MCEVRFQDLRHVYLETGFSCLHEQHDGYHMRFLICLPSRVPTIILVFCDGSCCSVISFKCFDLYVYVSWSFSFFFFFVCLFSTNEIPLWYWLQLKKMTTSWQKKREYENKIRPNKQIAVKNVKDEYNSPFFVCIINVWT